jgi:fructosamine-3-kinase
MRAALAAQIESLIGQPVSGARAVGGGSIAQSFCVRLQDGQRLFVKDYGTAPAELASREAEGLRWLARSGDLAVAEVVAVSAQWPVLILRHVESAPRCGDHAERLGRGLAALHARGAEQFGFACDNFIGPLPQRNSARPSWPRFYAEQRLEPLLRVAADGRHLSERVVAEARALLDAMEDRCGPPEPPARLHGDLWSGNVMQDEGGAPCLVDPAVYGGHREMDLAMMRLFGGFEPRAFDAYHECHPLAPGHAERVGLHQLYPLLVHVVLFGGGYATSFEDALRRYR